MEEEWNEEIRNVCESLSLTFLALAKKKQQHKIEWKNEMRHVHVVVGVAWSLFHVKSLKFVDIVELRDM